MKLSVVIPVYNVAQYLPKCLGSALAAVAALKCIGDGWDSEIICVNDGSTDDSGDILAKFSVENTCIRVISQENAGVSAARNAGLGVATGEWIHFLDSDDYVADDFYTRIFARIADTPRADVVVTAMTSLYVDGSSKIPNSEIGVGVVDGDVLKQVFRSKRMGAAYCMADKVCRRKILVDNGVRFMAGLHVGEDSLCCQSLLAFARCVVFDGTNNGYCYWHHQGSLTTKVTLEKIKFQVNAIAASIDLWRRAQTDGALLFARMGAASCLFLADNLSANEQNSYVSFLLTDQSFKNTILPFLTRCGSIKSRIVGMVLALAPCGVRGAVLKIMRRLRHA